MTRPKFKIKKDDVVFIRVGKDKGRQGKVLKVLRDEARVIVEGVNIVTRHVKPTAETPKGSIKKEMPIHISNVALIDLSTRLPTKAGYKIDENNQKVRFAKKSGMVV